MKKTKKFGLIILMAACILGIATSQIKSKELRYNPNATNLGNLIAPTPLGFVMLDSLSRLPAVDGSLLTNLNYSTYTGPTNTANGLVKLDSSGAYPSGDGSQLTSLSASNLNGQIPVTAERGWYTIKSSTSVTLTAAMGPRIRVYCKVGTLQSMTITMPTIVEGVEVAVYGAGTSGLLGTIIIATPDGATVSGTVPTLVLRASFRLNAIIDGATKTWIIE